VEGDNVEIAVVGVGYLGAVELALNLVDQFDSSDDVSVSLIYRDEKE